MTAPPTNLQATSREVRDRLVAALRLSLVGPGADHPFAIEALPGWERPINWYLTGFLIPSGTPPEKRADQDEDDDLGNEIPETAGLAEESTEERKAAKKGFFPSSMGLSFLAPKESRTLAVTIRWGDYHPDEVEGSDGKRRAGRAHRGGHALGLGVPRQPSDAERRPSRPLSLLQIRSVQRHLTLQSISLIDMITLLLGTAAAVMKSRQALILENLALRHQIGVLRRSAK